MKGRGFNNVLNLEGGINAWNGFVATGKPDAGRFLFEYFKTVDEYIALAWALEDGTGKFYGEAGKHFDETAVKGLFESLTKVEDKHKTNILKAYNILKGTDIPPMHLEKLSSSGYIEGGVSFDDAISWLKDEKRSLQDVLEFSMQLEINALDLYFKIMDEIEQEDAAAVFKSIIYEEKGHLRMLGKLLENSLRTE